MIDQYLKYGFYAKSIIEVMEPNDLSKPGLVASIKNYAVSLGIPYRQWHEWLADFYRDAPFIFVDVNRNEVFLDTETAFETPNIDHWFRDFVKPVAHGQTVFVRREVRERVAVFGSLMRAHCHLHAR